MSILIFKASPLNFCILLLAATLGAAKALLEHNKQLLSFIDGNLASIETLNSTKVINLVVFDLN